MDLSEGDFRKVFGAMQVRKVGDRLIVEDNPRMIPARILANVVVILASAAGTAYFWLGRTDDDIITGAYQFFGILLAIVCLISIIALIQLVVFAQFPITVDRQARTVSRGKRIHLEGKFKAEAKNIANPERPATFHVKLVQKGKSMFLMRTESQIDAREMANLINHYLNGSLSDAEIGEDALDHVG